MGDDTEFVMLDPVGVPQVAQPLKLSRRVTNLNGKALGLLFDGHYSAIYFWPALERRLRETFDFSSVVSRVKEGVTAGAPAVMLDEIASQSDIAVIGVGA